MDGWNTTFLLGRPIFRCHVSFRESTLQFLLEQKDDELVNSPGSRDLSMFLIEKETRCIGEFHGSCHGRRVKDSSGVSTLEPADSRLQC